MDKMIMDKMIMDKMMMDKMMNENNHSALILKANLSLPKCKLNVK